MGLFSDVLGFFSGAGKKNAISNATNALVSNYGTAQGQVGAENTRIQGLLNPYTTAGDQAVGAQSALLGLGGDAGAQQRAIDQLRSSPLYQSLYHNGQDAILQNASATGGLRGGNTEHSLYGLGTDTLAQVFQQQLANLGALSGQGLNAINSSGRFGADATDNIASLQTSIGQAKAGGILGRAGVDQQLWQLGGQTFNDAINAIAQAMGGFSGGGGGGSGLGSDFSALMSQNNAFANGLGSGPSYLDSNAAFGNLPY